MGEQEDRERGKGCTYGSQVRHLLGRKVSPLSLLYTHERTHP